ncbi:MAG: type II toxin-antitoxin system RelE/ParE family toxin [Candidatus Symbiobacter sp.]|nr:type II toxin-antitoxin system RelE/ParE family toxin [Candidatus Symbiobacter sp.]
MVELIVSEHATADLRKIALYSQVHWGQAASQRYKHLIDLARQKIVENPYLLASRPLKSSDINLRAVNLSAIPQPNPQLRVKHPRHIIYYRIIADDRIEILRVLHDKMNHKQALNTAIGQK